MSTKTIIPIDVETVRHGYRQIAPDAGTGSGGLGETWARKQPESVRTRVPWEQLYPVEEVADPKMVAAQRLLAGVISSFETACREVHGDPIAADDGIQSIQPILAELFCCRSLGEGFAAVINGVSIALLNQRGDPLTTGQIVAVTRSLKELRSHLFLSYEQALRILRELKKNDLKIHPQALQHLDLKDE